MRVAHNRLCGALLVLAGAGAFACRDRAGGAALEEVSAEVARLTAPVPESIEEERILARGLVGRVYERLGARPIWFGERGFGKEADALIETLRDAESHGLSPDDYHLEAIESAMSAARKPDRDARDDDAARAAELDVLLTDAFLVHAAHLAAGKVDPKTGKPDWDADPGAQENPRVWHALPGKLDLGRALETAVARNEVADTLRDLAPSDPEYARLRTALGSVRARIAEGRRGDDDEARVRAIRATLERWRWLPDSLGERRVEVNIPAFELALVEDGRSPVKALRSRVVVGEKDTPTPTFSDEIDEIVFHPTWAVPDSIAVKEILPGLDKDPQRLSRENMKVVSRVEGEEGAEVDPRTVPWYALGGQEVGKFPYLLVQNPGEGNPLGRVKFRFPNDHAVYLHDTNAPHLFDKDVRALSHGCVRVQRADDLALALVGGMDGWNEERVRDAMALRPDVKPEPRHVKLEPPVPVHLVYFTATVTGSEVTFHDDVYGYDAGLANALDARPK